MSRRHEVKKAFINDAERGILDMILVGTVDVENIGGDKHQHEFVIRAVVVGPATSNGRVQHYQVLIPTPKTHQPILA